MRKPVAHGAEPRQIACLSRYSTWQSEYGEPGDACHVAHQKAMPFGPSGDLWDRPHTDQPRERFRGNGHMRQPSVHKVDAVASDAGVEPKSDGLDVAGAGTSLPASSICDQTERRFNPAALPSYRSVDGTLPITSSRNLRHLLVAEPTRTPTVSPHGLRCRNYGSFGPRQRYDNVGIVLW